MIAGVPSGTLDIQVRWFSATDDEEVRRLITDDPIHSYKNSDEETVTWELVQIFAIEPFEPRDSGDEVVGFIAETSELTELA